MDVDQAWDSFKKTGASIQKASLAGKLDTIAAQLNEIQQNTQRTAEIVPQLMADDTAIDTANEAAPEMGGAPPMDMGGSDDGGLTDLLGGELLGEDENMKDDEKIPQEEELQDESDAVEEDVADVAADEETVMDDVDSGATDDIIAEDTEELGDDSEELGMDEEALGEDVMAEEDLSADVPADLDVAPEPAMGGEDEKDALLLEAAADALRSGDREKAMRYMEAAKGVSDMPSEDPLMDEPIGEEPIDEPLAEEPVGDEEEFDPLAKSAVLKGDLAKIVEVLNSAIAEVNNIINGDSSEEEVAEEVPEEVEIEVVAEEPKEDVNEEIALNPIEASCEDKEEGPVMKSISEMIAMKKSGKATIFDEVKPAGKESGSQENPESLLDEVSTEKEVGSGEQQIDEVPLMDTDRPEGITKHIKTLREARETQRGQIMKAADRPDASLSVNGELTDSSDFAKSVAGRSTTVNKTIGYGVNPRDAVAKDLEDYKAFMGRQ